MHPHTHNEASGLSHTSTRQNPETHQHLPCATKRAVQRKRHCSTKCCFMSRDNTHCATIAAQCTRNWHVHRLCSPLQHHPPEDTETYQVHNTQHKVRTASGVSPWQYPPHMGRASFTTQHANTCNSPLSVLTIHHSRTQGRSRMPHSTELLVVLQQTHGLASAQPGRPAGQPASHSGNGIHNAQGYCQSSTEGTPSTHV